MSVPATSTLVEVTEALAAALAPLRALDADLQIGAYFNPNPTPPSIDVYPADPFYGSLAFAREGGRFSFTVRARVSTADYVAASQLLLALIDPGSGLAGVLFDDSTLGGVVDDVTIADDGVSGFREYVVDPTSGGRLLGVEWRVEVLT